MAWSDAARAAALATRRAHSKAKHTFTVGGGHFFALNKTNAVYARNRKQIAAGLRAARRGVFTHRAKALSKAAVRATAYRNAARHATVVFATRVPIAGRKTA
jgi:hypothetical protein